MSEAPPLSEEEARKILYRLEAAVKFDEAEFVLIGGQAVSLWAGRLLDPNADPELQEIAASKDIDFVGNQAIAKHVAVLLGGDVKLATMDDHATPNSGVILFKDSEGFERQLDFLDAPAGLYMSDVLETATLFEIPKGPGGEPPFRLWVIHPERLLESRVANLSLPDKQGPLAINQLRAAVKCSRAFALEILNSDELDEHEAIRTVLKYNKRIYKLAWEKRTRVLAYGVDLLDAMVLDDRLPQEFFELGYPGWIRKLERRRERQERRRGDDKPLNTEA